MSASPFLPPVTRNPALSSRYGLRFIILGVAAGILVQIGTTQNTLGIDARWAFGLSAVWLVGGAALTLIARLHLSLGFSSAIEVTMQAIVATILVASTLILLSLSAAATGRVVGAGDAWAWTAAATYPLGLLLGSVVAVWLSLRFLRELARGFDPVDPQHADAGVRFAIVHEVGLLASAGLLLAAALRAVPIIGKLDLPPWTGAGAAAGAMAAIGMAAAGLRRDARVHRAGVDAVAAMIAPLAALPAIWVLLQIFGRYTVGSVVVTLEMVCAIAIAACSLGSLVLASRRGTFGIRERVDQWFPRIGIGGSVQGLPMRSAPATGGVPGASALPPPTASLPAWVAPPPSAPSAAAPRSKWWEQP
ncbi:MAG: hypothetical protein ACYDDF_12755 [Thermoplasmatota archaeon]